MNIVAIETATESVGVAVRTEAGVQAELTLHGRRRHVESLTPAMEHLFDQVGLAPGDLQVVAVDLGPGLFTGLRVGVSAAKGLAQALGIGVVGLSSLDILARAAAESGHRGPVLAAVDARRGEVFAVVVEVADVADGADVAGGIDEAGSTVPIVGPRLFAPDELAASVRKIGGTVVAVGDGAQRYADVLGAVPGLHVVTTKFSCPSPSTQLAMAVERVQRGESPVQPQHLVPLYMRDADAKSNFAQISRA